MPANEVPKQWRRQPVNVYSEVFDLKPTSKLAQSCLKNSAHLLQIWFLRMVSVLGEYLPLPARDERGEGRGGGIPNHVLQCSLLSPALSSLRGGEGEDNSATLNT